MDEQAEDMEMLRRVFPPEERERVHRYFKGKWRPEAVGWIFAESRRTKNLEGLHFVLRHRLVRALPNIGRDFSPVLGQYVQLVNSIDVSSKEVNIDGMVWGVYAPEFVYYELSSSNMVEEMDVFFNIHRRSMDVEVLEQVIEYRTAPYRSGLVASWDHWNLMNLHLEQLREELRTTTLVALGELPTPIAQQIHRFHNF